MKKLYQVFVSSTYTDLKDERKQVFKSLQGLNCIPVGMELFPATNDEQFVYIKRVIDETDYYVLIIGEKYGSVDSNGVSYTEKEFDYAKSKGIPILTFYKSDNRRSNNSRYDEDVNKKEKLKKFKEKAMSMKMCFPWNEKADLASGVLTSLVDAMTNIPRNGWIRSNISVASREIPKGIVVFITGTNGVGKTTISNCLANRGSVAETNVMRHTLRTWENLFKEANKNDDFDLLADSTIDLDGHDDYVAQCMLLSKTIEGIADYYVRNSQENGAIIEGINILPEHIQSIKGKALFINLVTKDKNVLLARLSSKAQNDQIRTKYTSNIDKILKTQEIINNQFINNQYGNRFVIDNSSIDKSIDNVVEEILILIRAFETKDRNILNKYEQNIGKNTISGV
ncbi:MAG: DUF4062 domain-containing protein [Clostridiales bacterium]|nr:DUF4062 domain-containing protein [Clostridiales bacterium]